jgi:ribose transport system permease protein
VLALGATIPIVTGRFDLSIGYGLGLTHVMVMYLLVEQGWPWPAACAAVIVGGALAGVVNGVIVEFAQIDSFIATLGTGSVLYAITGWVTGGARILPTGSGLPAGFTDLYDSKLLGLPVSAFYVLGLGIVLWLVLEHLPIGRSLYVIGSNKRAADLLGIPSRRYVVYSYAASGLVTGCAGVLLAAQQQIGDPSIGMDYLLPAFSAALLGSTAIKLGRVNAMGTLVAVSILAIGLSGLGQLGAQFWATPLFNGATLLAAVGLAGWSSRRRIRAGAKASQSAAAVAPVAGPEAESVAERELPGHDATLDAL